jgi:Domain of unknown function (DUF4365)
VVGWWYYEPDARHFDDWVRHGLPHLLLLHDLEARVSYWVHVTGGAVVSTGKGYKILVPRAQTVDAEHRDELLAVAARGKPVISLEGSAWTAPAAGIGPARLLRYAVMAPRLVAPHPNAGISSPIGPEQAVAMFLQCRPQYYERFAHAHSAVPSVEQAAGSRVWSWRFAAAVARLVTDGATDAFLPLVADAPSPDRRAAACVLAACALMNDDSHDEAIEVLTTHVDSMTPVDHAWLLVQRARARAEIGQVELARQDAVQAQRSLVGDPDDVTASAIGGAAALLLFTTADWGTKDLDKVIIASDTTVAWWRSQTISYGLVDGISRTFKRWAEDESVSFGGEDVANNRLLSAKLNADVTGDHQAWRTSGSLLARHNLSRLLTMTGQPSAAPRRSTSCAAPAMSTLLTWRCATSGGPARCGRSSTSRPDSPRPRGRTPRA